MKQFTIFARQDKYNPEFVSVPRKELEELLTKAYEQGKQDAIMAIDVCIVTAQAEIDKNNDWTKAFKEGVKAGGKIFGNMMNQNNKKK